VNPVPSRSDLLIRPAEPDDWPQMWAIWEPVVAAGDTYTYDPATPEDVARAGWLPAEPGRGETWVALADSGLRGMLGMYRIAPNQGGPGAHVANGSYMVSAAARGQGVGRALVEHSLWRAREAGYLAMQFNAVAATNVHAVKLYEDLGFDTIGRVPRGFRHPQDGFVDLVIMYREL
jgi:GNAT superfamily N-acetyltransferase